MKCVSKLNKENKKKYGCDIKSLMNSCIYALPVETAENVQIGISSVPYQNWGQQLKEFMS